MMARGTARPARRPTGPSSIPSAPGTYALVLTLTRRRRIVIGRLGPALLPAGHYVYVGSARGPGGLAARLAHHARRAERPHWHIDHLRRIARLVEVWTSTAAGDSEHDWAARLAAADGSELPVRRFGASDCRCPTHLVRCRQLPTPDLLGPGPSPSRTPWQAGHAARRQTR
jgi:Uri superfamily endonuclease